MLHKINHHFNHYENKGIDMELVKTLIYLTGVQIVKMLIRL